jgi:two-component system sensor histidine kinase BaeS
MRRLLIDVILRLVIGVLFALVVIGAPVFYILFAAAPLDPLATLAGWHPNHLALRLVGAALYIVALSFLGAMAAGRWGNNPFDELRASIRRIAIGDFGVRLGPFRSREPRDLTTIADEFNRMASELQRAEELRNNLMADVSHELRTPLTALEGSLRAALDRVYTLDEAEVANLYGQTRHLIRLVNDLHELALADARRLPLALQPADLSELIEETRQLFAPLAEERGVTLSASAAPTPVVAVDEVRIRQVLHNLLSNALRHTPPGGTITVACGVEGASAMISVADTGDGLEPDQLSAVFDRFYRTDRSRSRDTGGTGLGLAIVSALVATHGGTVEAASAGRGQGSAFTIRLPLGEASAAPTNTQPPYATIHTIIN